MALRDGGGREDGKPLTYMVDFDGNTLRMVIANPPFLPGRERRIVLSRIE